MKYAPKSVLILVLLCLVLIGCGDKSEKSQKPRIDKKIEKPEVNQRDSSKLNKRGEPSFPDASHPKRVKKKNGDELDTLRPVKA